MGRGMAEAPHRVLPATITLASEIVQRTSLSRTRFAYPTQSQNQTRTAIISVQQFLNTEQALRTIMGMSTAAPSVTSFEDYLIKLTRLYAESALRLYGAADGLARLLAFVRHVDEHGQAAVWFLRLLVPEIADTLEDLLDEGTLEGQYYLKYQVDVDLFFRFDRSATNVHDGLDNYGDRFVVRMVDDLCDVDKILTPLRMERN